MDIPPIGELELAAKKLVWTAHKQGNLRDFTPRLIRQTIEKQFKLEEGALDVSEFKSALKAATKYAIDNEPPEDEDEDKPKVSPQRKNKRKSDGKIKAEAKEESPSKLNLTPKAKAKSKAKAASSEDEGSDAPTPKKKRKVMPKAKKIASDEEEDHKNEGPSPKKKTKAKKIVSEDEVEEIEKAPEKAPRSTSSKPRTKQGKKDSKIYKSAEHVPTSDIEQDEPDAVEVPKPIEIKKQPTSPTLLKREQPESSKFANIEMEDDAPKSESELSVLIDEPLKRKRKKSNTGEKASKKASEKSRPKKSAKSAVALSKDEETIKRLKSFVVACGMRKVWSKVFQGLDTPQQQIKKLREILADLGMTGRMSMEQAKAIKEKRELEKELADVKEFAEKMEGRASRSHGNATTKMNIDAEDSAKEDKSSEDEEVEAPKKRPMNARKSIMAFLGDQSDEE